MPIRWWPVGSSMPIHSANADWQPLMIVVARLFMSGWLVVDRRLERVTGIEPALSAWEADVLPLNYTREVRRRGYPTRRKLRVSGSSAGRGELATATRVGGR
jgi:hypothetical protein